MDRWTNVASFQYCPLTDRHSIRLLRVMPGLSNDVLNCQIVHGICLEGPETPKYTAISYAWGSSNRTEVILVNALKFHITKNAKDVLLCFRDDKVPRMAWIDSICIDQSNPDEKSDQIFEMGRIFSNADETMVWLGHASENSDLAMQFMPKINKAFQNFGPFQEVTDGMLLEKLGTEYVSSCWKALGDMLARPWFRRLWVIQEVALSGSVYVMCGAGRLQWSTIGDMIENLYRRRLVHLITCNPEAGALTTGASTLLGMQTIRKRHFENGVNEKLSAILFEVMGFEATNAQDQIFGILGLLPETDTRGLHMSYRETVEDIYTKATLWSINEEQQYDILYLSGSTHIRSIPNLPSWVPNFSRDLLLNPFGIPAPGQVVHFQAGGVIERGQKIWVQIKNKCLVLQGLILDSIKDFGHIRISSNQSQSKIAHKSWRDWVLEVLDLVNTYSDKGYIPGSNEDIWRTIIANTSHPAKGPAGPEYQKYFEAFRHLYLNVISDECLEWRQALINISQDHNIEEDLKSSASSYLFAFLDATIGRRFCVTERGRLGLVPSGVATGDKVCIVQGASVPFVIRDALGNPDERILYTMVGDCYIDGLMAGECLSTETHFEEILIQ